MIIYPKCLNQKQSAAYTSDGFMLPCCWLDDPPVAEYVKDCGLKDPELLVSNNKNIKDIFTSDQWELFFYNLLKNPKNASVNCKIKCGVDTELVDLTEKKLKQKLTKTNNTRITDVYSKEQQYLQPNLDISNKCMLRCPQCARQQTYGKQRILQSFDLPTEDFQKIINYYVNKISFCGQLSDPIYHPKFLDLLALSELKNIKIRISTNGSNKSTRWWEKAYRYGKGLNVWYFGVDGIDKKSEIYRIGSDFNSVWEAMIRGRDCGHIIVWQYIIFKYNEDDINRACEIAKKENFTLLFINTSRPFEKDKLNLKSNINFNLQPPNQSYLSKKIKKEYFGYKTQQFIKWNT